MKSLFTLLFIVVGVTFSFGQDKQEKVQTDSIQTEIFCDHCSKCGSCGQRILFSIQENKGIRKVDIDDKNHQIIVTYNADKVSLDQIRKSISLAGFKADDIAADKTAYTNLDGCCKRK